VGIAMLRRYFACAGFVLLIMAVQPAFAVPFGWSLGQIPFGPFKPDQTVVLTAYIGNSSANTIYFCDCVGDQNTYSFGGTASITGSTAQYYNFQFGNGTVPGGFTPPASVHPGESTSFTFAEYVANESVPEGLYPFSASLQLFQATPDRPLLGQSGFGGNWQVVAAPEPSSAALLLVGFGATCGLWRSRRAKIPSFG
jgi:PEP-CTERM motif-containing protein